MSELVKKVGIISAADFLRLMVKTLIGIALARILTQTDYGTYRQLFMVYSLLFSIFMIGLPQSVYYFIPKSDAETQKKFLRQTLDLFTLLGLTCSILLLVFRADVGRLFHNPELHHVLIFYAFYPFFMFVSQLYYFAMIGMQQARKAAVFMLFSVISDLILVLGAALISKNLTIVICGIMVSVFLQWLYARIMLNPFCAGGTSFRFDKDLLKQQLLYSLPIGLSSIITVVQSQVDKFIISAYFTPEQFAVFSIGAAELPFIWIIANSVNAVILPEMNRCCNKDMISDLYRGAVRKNALLVFPLMAYCFIFAPFIIQILYSTKYLGAVSFFRIYLIMMPLRIATYALLFQVFNKNRYIFQTYLVTVAVNIGLSLTLIKLIGIQGPAISSVVVTYLTVIIYLTLIRSKLGMKLLRLFPIAALGRTMLAAVIAGILCYFLLFVKLPFIGQFALGSISFVLIYYFIGRLLRAIHPYDRDMLLNIIGSSWRRFKGLLNV